MKKLCPILLGIFLAANVSAQILPPEEDPVPETAEIQTEEETGAVADDAAFEENSANEETAENVPPEEGSLQGSSHGRDSAQGSVRESAAPAVPAGPVDPCSPNPCEGETPLCTPLSPGAKSNAGYVCGCNPSSDTCMPGRECAVRCSGYDMTCTNDPTAGDIYWACVPCSRGKECRCGEGKIADGSGGCIVDDKCSPNPCPEQTPVCTLKPSDPNGYVCGCNPFSCPAGQECSLPKDGTYVCAPCAEGSECRCEKGFVADGKGGCKQKQTCAAVTCPKGTSCVDAGNRLCCKVNDIDCGEGCLNCDRTLGVCKECQNGFYAENQKCVRCPENCLACAAANACTVCDDGFRLFEGKCVSAASCDGVVCPSGQTCQNGVCGVSCFPQNCAEPIHCNPETHDCTGSRCGCPKGVSDMSLCIRCE